jgi:hypothetical protein
MSVGSMAQPTPRSNELNTAMIIVEWFALALLVLLTLVIATKAVAAVGTFGAGVLLLTLLVVPIGYASADVGSGLVHFLADNFGHTDMAIVGHTFIFRFRQHHDDQNIICGLDFRELVGSSALIMLPVLIPSALLAPIESQPWGLPLAVYGWTVVVIVTLTNQFHRWAHDPKCPQWVRPLQRWRIVLSPRHHAVHHRAPHHEHFCITVGWMNPVLDRIRFFHHVSNVLVALRVPQSKESVMGRARATQLADALARPEAIATA